MRGRSKELVSGEFERVLLVIEDTLSRCKFAATTNSQHRTGRNLINPDGSKTLTTIESIWWPAWDARLANLERAETVDSFSSVAVLFCRT